jgi:hypothetical protein
MRSTLIVSLVMVAGALAAACYSPKIEEGAFLCDDGGACPEGFGCDHGKCFKSGFAECPLCTPQASVVAGACDPVCQTGCKCTQKCEAAAPKPFCVDVGTAPKALGEVCDPTRDTCARGHYCVDDRPDNNRCGAHCFRFCTTSQDCAADSRCLDAVGIDGTNMSYGLCSSAIEACNPLLGTPGDLGANPHCNRADARPFPAFACYVLSVDEPDVTVCECAGSLTDGQACANMHDCAPGFECITTGMGSVCRQLCTAGGPGKALPGLACPALKHCKAFDKGHGRFGYCIE